MSGRHDATLDQALDLRAKPAFPRGLAFAIAGVLAVLLAVFGAWAKLQQREAAKLAMKNKPPPAAKPEGGR